MKIITYFILSFFFYCTNAQEEIHLKNIKQLTFGGDNAEAYFSFNGKYLILQSNNPAWQVKCDQIFLLDINKILENQVYQPMMVSTGKGRTTCSYFMPDDKHFLYASTHLSDSLCPPVPGQRDDNKYVWPIYSGYDIFVADLEGRITKQLTYEDGYDAEATVSPKGDKIVFTSVRNGDIELFTMDIDGKNVKQITNEPGYDGGAFFSPDGSKLVFRASRPKTDEEIMEYKELLGQGLVMPTKMEIFTCNTDGSDLKQVTNLGKANWAPFFHPSGKKIIFSSNHHSQRGYDFQLFLINIDGSGLERVTYESIFNSFPMFSPDGKKIVFSSNRANNNSRDTNVFIAEWKD